MLINRFKVEQLFKNTSWIPKRSEHFCQAHERFSVFWLFLLLRLLGLYTHYFDYLRSAFEFVFDVVISMSLHFENERVFSVRFQWVGARAT